MKFLAKKSPSLNEKFKARKEELSLKYNIDKLDCSNMTKEEILKKERELEALKRLLLTTEFGKYYF